MLPLAMPPTLKHQPEANEPPLLLMGLRGSGKSTLGRLLAARLDVGFVDLDDAVLERLRCRSVAEAWARLGEPAFRQAETDCLGEWVGEGQDPGCAAPARVVALGGGTPTAPGAAELLRRTSAGSGVKVVYLRANPATLRRRLERTEPEAQARSLTRREEALPHPDPLPKGEGERYPLPGPSLRGAEEGGRPPDPNRPSLTGADPLDEIAAVFAARDPLYRELATHVIQIDEKSGATTLGALVDRLAVIYNDT